MNTPETDREAYDDPTPGYEVVSADFARNQELKLTAMRDALESCVEAINTTSITRLLSARNKAKRVLENAEVSDDFAQSLEAENAKLREALEKFRGQFDCYECTGTAEDCLDSLDNAQRYGSAP